MHCKSVSVLQMAKHCKHRNDATTHKTNATEKDSKMLQSQKLFRSKNLQTHKTNAKEKCC